MLARGQGWVHRCQPIDTLTRIPLVFHLSKRSTQVDSSGMTLFVVCVSAMSPIGIAIDLGEKKVFN